MKLKKLGLFRTVPNRMYVRKAKEFKKENFILSVASGDLYVSYDTGQYSLTSTSSLLPLDFMMDFIKTHTNVSGYIKLHLTFTPEVPLVFENTFNFVAYSKGELTDTIDEHYFVFGSNSEFGMCIMRYNGINVEEQLLYEFIYNNDLSQYVTGVNAEVYLEGN